MSNLTPGPWMIGEQFRGMDRYNYSVCTEDGKPVESTFANVALQTAAPEMYEALKAWEHWYSIDSTEFNRDTAQNMGVKALAKAEGRIP